MHAHDTGKEFIPLMKNIEFNKFQHRRPDYAQVIGARTTVSIPIDGIQDLLPRIKDSLKIMGLRARLKPDPARLKQIRNILNSLAPNQIESKLPDDKAGKTLQKSEVGMSWVIWIAAGISINSQKHCRKQRRSRFL